MESKTYLSEDRPGVCLLGSERHKEGISKENLLSLWSQNKEAKGWKAFVLYLSEKGDLVRRKHQKILFFKKLVDFLRFFDYLLTEFPLFSRVVSSDHLFLLFFC